MEGRGDLRLQLRRVLAGGAVGRDLVEGGGRHLDCFDSNEGEELARIEVQSGGVQEDGWSNSGNFLLDCRLVAGKGERHFQWADESADGWCCPLPTRQPAGR